MEFFRKGYWSGLPFTSPQGFSQPRIENRSPALQVRKNSLPAEPPGTITYSRQKKLKEPESSLPMIYLFVCFFALVYKQISLYWGLLLTFFSLCSLEVFFFRLAPFSCISFLILSTFFLNLVTLLISPSSSSSIFSLPWSLQ